MFRQNYSVFGLNIVNIFFVFFELIGWIHLFRLNYLTITPYKIHLSIHR